MEENKFVGLETNEATVRDLANRFWEGLLKINPILGTAVGDDRYDHLIEDPSEDGLAKKKNFFEDIAKELLQIERTRLTSDLRVTLRILDFVVAKNLREIENRIDRLWAVTHMFGGPQQLIVFLSTLHQFDTPERVDKFTARLVAFQKYLDKVSVIAKEAALVGQTQPLLVVERTIGQVERLISGSPEDIPIILPLKDVSKKQKERIVDVLGKHIWPAFDRYLETLQFYKEHARFGIGLNNMSKGEEIYTALIENSTTLPYIPQEVHNIGLEQLEKILEERQQIAEKLGFANADKALEAYNASGENTPKSREEMLELARAQIQRSWNAASKFFGRLPKNNCEVRPVEEFQENDVPAAYYMSPSGDGSRPGIYWVNTGNLEKRRVHQLAAISFHEAIPGHHFQHSIAQEFEDRLAVQRFGGILVGSSFVEGWGLYSERLADEMGLYQNEYERIGMLEAQSWRACRLIVDTGIHALGWTREQAVAQMEKAGISTYEAEVEVDRYIAMPAQALSYMIGQRAILEIRETAQKAKGKNFSIKKFHDKVLSFGALPLKALREEVLRGKI